VKIIAHRANINGPNLENENSPSYIMNAISLGFDVEVDVWCVEDIIFLGHDRPQYEVSKEFIGKIEDYSWIHCKNIQALQYFKEFFPKSNYFWHQSDDYTITSLGYFWTYPGKKIVKNSVLVLPETLSAELEVAMISCSPYGICTDYPIRYDQTD
jgi:hypothetical protein